MKFFLGTQYPHWLKDSKIPLFVSRRRIEKIKKLPRASYPWALDSGAFSELSNFGKWTITPREYVTTCNRLRQEVGNLLWAAPMDWMCEPFIVAKTGRSVSQHQWETAWNYLDLKFLDPAFPFIPVLQGWEEHDYERHIEMYFKLGVDLTKQPLIGLGSVCRRQSSQECSDIIYRVWSKQIRIHGFGLKHGAIENACPMLESADSMAWSFRARHEPPMEGHPHKHCHHCRIYAEDWHKSMLAAIKRYEYRHIQMVIPYKAYRNEPVGVGAL